MNCSLSVVDSHAQPSFYCKERQPMTTTSSSDNIFSVSTLVNNQDFNLTSSSTNDKLTETSFKCDDNMTPSSTSDHRSLALHFPQLNMHSNASSHGELTSSSLCEYPQRVKNTRLKRKLKKGSHKNRMKHHPSSVHSDTLLLSTTPCGSSNSTPINNSSSTAGGNNNNNNNNNHVCKPKRMWMHDHLVSECSRADDEEDAINEDVDDLHSSAAVHDPNLTSICQKRQGTTTTTTTIKSTHSKRHKNRKNNSSRHLQKSSLHHHHHNQQQQQGRLILKFIRQDHENYCVTTEKLDLSSPPPVPASQLPTKSLNLTNAHLEENNFSKKQKKSSNHLTVNATEDEESHSQDANKLSDAFNGLPQVLKCKLPDGRQFAVGDIVWAKIQGYPFWPSRISKIALLSNNSNDDADDDALPLSSKYKCCVDWLAWSQQCSYLPCNKLFHFQQYFNEKFSTKNKTKLYKKAIDEAKKLMTIKKKSPTNNASSSAPPPTQPPTRVTNSRKRKLIKSIKDKAAKNNKDDDDVDKNNEKDPKIAKKHYSKVKHLVKVTNSPTVADDDDDGNGADDGGAPLHNVSNTNVSQLHSTYISSTHPSLSSSFSLISPLSSQPAPLQPIPSSSLPPSSTSPSMSSSSMLITVPNIIQSITATTTISVPPVWPVSVHVPRYFPSIPPSLPLSSVPSSSQPPPPPPPSSSVSAPPAPASVPPLPPPDLPELRGDLFNPYVISNLNNADIPQFSDDEEMNVRKTITGSVTI